MIKTRAWYYNIIHSLGRELCVISNIIHTTLPSLKFSQYFAEEKSSPSALRPLHQVAEERDGWAVVCKNPVKNVVFAFSFLHIRSALFWR